MYEHKGLFEAAVPSVLKRVCVRTASANLANQNQIPHCKQLGIQLATLPSSGVLDSRGSRQMSNPTLVGFKHAAWLVARRNKFLVRKESAKPIDFNKVKITEAVQK